MRVIAAQAGSIGLACALAILPFTAIDLALAAAGAESPGFLDILAAIASCWLYGALAHLALGELEGRPVTLGEASSSAAPMIGTVLGLSLVQGIGIALGLLLFVVPGVWLWVSSYVLIPVALFERTQGSAAFRRSNELTRRGRAPILVIGAVSASLLAITVALALGPLVLATLDGASASAIEIGGALDYAVLGATTAIQIAWSAIGTVTMTVVYARLRDRHAGIDGRSLAEVFA